MNNIYGIEIMRTVSKTGKQSRYYKKVCDSLVRITKVDYDEIRDNCSGVYNLFTNSDNRITRHFTGCSYSITSSISKAK